jgi:hypothetical protein
MGAADRPADRTHSDPRRGRTREQPDRAPRLPQDVCKILDESELSARETADQLGHEKVSMTQDNYLGAG